MHNSPSEDINTPLTCNTVAADDLQGVPIRFRAVVLGLVFTIFICAVTPFNNAYRHATPLGGGHFPLAPFFILVWLSLFMGLWGRFFRRSTLFTGRELLLAWIQMVLGSGIAYTGLVRTFFFNLTVPFRFATVENRWKEVLHPMLPASWFPSNQEAVETLYSGLKQGRDMTWPAILKQIPWNDWMTPLLTWGIFILVCYFVMLCMVNVLSRQWIHNERMNFPLLRVPQMLADALDSAGMGTLLSNRFLIAGVLIPVCLHTLNGLAFYFPSVPQLPTLVLAGPYFPEYGIFSGFHKLKIYFYPAFIGFAFITSRQISFSFWFMFISGCLLIGLLAVLGYNIPASSLGITFGPTLSRPEETQMLGAFGVFFFFLMWLSRTHILTTVKSMFRPNSAPPFHTQWFNAAWSAWGVFIGLLFIMIWFTCFGMPFIVSIPVVCAFFMIMIVASRIIAQGGVAYFTVTAAPMDGMLAFFGPGFFTATGLLTAGIAQKMLFVDLRESLMPSLLHTGKVHAGISSKKIILTGIFLTLVLSVMISFAAMLALCYKYGLRVLDMEWASRTTITVYENIFTLIENPVRPGNWVMIFAAAGAVAMLILVVCYQRFYWWPLHPIGYLTAYSSAMRILWFSFFLGWVFNALCVRYGGVGLFKKIRFIFVGLIIGDFMMGGFWAFIGMLTQASYQVLPG